MKYMVLISAKKTLYYSLNYGLLTIENFILKSKSKLLRFSSSQKKTSLEWLDLCSENEYSSKLSKIMREHVIYENCNLRQKVEGKLYPMRAGCSWRDLDFVCDDYIDKSIYHRELGTKAYRKHLCMPGFHFITNV